MSTAKIMHHIIYPHKTPIVYPCRWFTRDAKVGMSTANQLRIGERALFVSIPLCGEIRRLDVRKFAARGDREVQPRDRRRGSQAEGGDPAH